MQEVPWPRLPPWPVLAAIVVNLAPLIGVLFWGWSAFALLLLYWLENIVIGVRTLISMFANAFVAGGMNWIGAVLFGGFFTLHYGLFCFGHGIFLLALFGNNVVGDSILDLAGAVRTLLETEQGLALGLTSIVAWQVVMFVLFIARGEVRRTNVLDLMGAPYPRIIQLHLALILGGFLLLLLNQPLAGLVMLVAIKTWFDVTEARKQSAPAPAANEP